MNSLRQLVLIARATALEGLQQPIALLLLLAMVALTTLGPLVQLFTFGEEGRLARDSGLAFMLVMGLAMTAFTAGFTLSDELRRGTAAAVLVKPVGRLTFLLGKYLGVVAVLALFCLCGTVCTLLAERTAEHYIELEYFADAIVDRYTGLGALAAAGLALLVAAALNFFRNVRFGLAAFLLVTLSQAAVLLLCGFINRAGELIPYALQVNARIIPASALVFLLLCVYGALATAFSTRLLTGATLVLCGAVFFLGFLSDSFRHASFLSWLSALVPNVQHFWRASALDREGSIPLGYVAQALAYAASLTALYLAAGYAALRGRDLG